MSERQLRFFPHAKPLLERLGKDFFNAVPRRPGVYLMFGPADRILYIGQTANLRVRLGSYKNCNPNHTPRKVLRLVHQVERIDLELCESATEAQLRENELLRTHRPKFNRVNTFPKAHYFIGMQRHAMQLRFWLTNEAGRSAPAELPAANETLYGAFKGNTRMAFGALAMLLFSYVHNPESHHDFPFGMLRSPAAKTVVISFQNAQRDCSMIEESVANYLVGQSSQLLDLLAGAIPNGPALHRSLHEAAYLTLTEFYESGPRRTRRLRDQYEAGAGSALVLQERLDDLIVLARRS